VIVIQGQKPNILIIGSETTLGPHVREALARQEYRYTCAASVEEAVSAHRHLGVDAALVDMASLGAPAGLSLAASLRRALSHLPIVVLTSAPGVAIAFEAMRLGATDCLRAPVSPTDLREAVERAVQWRRSAAGRAGALDRLSREMSSRTNALVSACAESGIGSSVALEEWVSALYGRDRWMWDHVRRVANISVQIATAMGTHPRMVAEIGRAALLHDVGRLATPAGVIQKPAPLTCDEQTLMRTHVQASYEVAMSVTFLEPLAVTLFTVRERYDGSGYPLGLAGESIPFGARVIAVAEAFDSLSPEEADETAVAGANAGLVRGAGTLFDPLVVRAWLRCQDNGVRRSACY
jgi:putative two-component system response regulator